MITEKFNDNSFILEVKTNPKVNFNDMLKGLEYINNNKDLPRELYILEDATDAIVLFGIDAINVLTEKMYNIAKKYTFIRHAVIHNSPKNTAFAMLMQQNKTASNYILQVFSTKRSALKWLNNNN